MTHPERSRPIRDRKGPRGTARTQAAAWQTAARMTELDALAALYAEQHGDTPELQAERRALLDRKTLALPRDWPDRAPLWDDRLRRHRPRQAVPEWLEMRPLLAVGLGGRARTRRVVAPAPRGTREHHPDRH